MALYLVTGGAGFIGSNLVERLIELGHKVRVLDDFSTGKRENLCFSGFELIEGDIRDIKICKKVCKGVDFVLHQAALGSVLRSVENPLLTHEVNATGTLNMLIAAKESKVKRFIYASSSSVYGGTEDTKQGIIAKTETMSPSPLSPYAVSKLTGEYYCQVFYKIYGLETVCLRYFNVFGKKQDPSSRYAAVVPKFIKSLLDNKAPTIYGDGNQSRDFTFIDNVVEANLKACEAAPSVCGKVYNIACGRNISVNELFQSLLEIMNKDITPLYAPPRPGDVRHSLANIEKASKELNYRVICEFKEGLIKTVSWFTQKEVLS